MCLLCEDPDLTPEQLAEQVQALAARHRFVVQHVAGSRCRPELAYTAGLTAHGLAELVVVGVRQEPAAELLRHWGEYTLEESVVLAGETLQTGPWLTEAVEVDEAEEHLAVAVLAYGAVVRGLQLAWAEARGRWPWEPGHRARHAGQPLVGSRAPRYCGEHRPDRLDVPPVPPS